MESLLITGSIVSLLNCLVLIIYPMVTNQGERNFNFRFSLLVLTLTMILTMPLLSAFTREFGAVLFTLRLYGIILTGPVYILFARWFLTGHKRGNRLVYIAFLPAAAFMLSWMLLPALKSDYRAWNLFHRMIMLMFISLLSFGILELNHTRGIPQKTLRQLNIIHAWLFAIWLASFLKEISGLRYVEEAAVLGCTFYLAIRIVYNRGFVIDTFPEKYQKTGLKESERQRIIKELDRLMVVEKVYRENTLSEGRLARRLNTGIHALSQVINEEHQLTFFEFIGSRRISDARELLEGDPIVKISDIAYQVGYNSLSAFNTAFKKQTGKTPTQFRNENKA